MEKYKLNFELIPTMCAEQNLRTVMTEGEWSRISRMIRENANLTCECCGKKVLSISQLEAHEVWKYKKVDVKGKTKRIQKLNTIDALCIKCHRVKHAGRSISMGHGEQVQEQFCLVNGCTVREYHKALVEALEKNEKRSKHKWLLCFDIDKILTKKLKNREEYDDEREYI